MYTFFNPESTSLVECQAGSFIFPIEMSVHNFKKKRKYKKKVEKAKKKKNNANLSLVSKKASSRQRRTKTNGIRSTKKIEDLKEKIRE